MKIETPTLSRYGNADDPLLIRYAHALLDAFPGEHDERPARGLRHWRSFEPYADELRREVAAWKSGAVRHHSLTDLCWHVGQRIYNRRGGGARDKGSALSVGEHDLFDFDPVKKRLFLRFGLLELAKLCCREIEEATHLTAAR